MAPALDQQTWKIMLVALIVTSLQATLLVSPLRLDTRIPAASAAPQRLAGAQAIVQAVNDLTPVSGGYRLDHPRHQAIFGHNGPEVAYPDTTLRWAWQLESVRAGDQPLAEVWPGPVAPLAGSDAVVRYPRGPIVEQYVLRAGAIEQQFVIARPLDLAGADLTIAGTVTTAGALIRQADGWAWHNGLGQAITLGDVYVFDATGATIPATMQVLPGATRIVVDGVALSRAAYPVTVDPEIGTGDFRISEQGANDSDINFTAFTPTIAYNSIDNEYLVAWVGTLGPGEEDIYIQRLDAATGAALSTAGAAAGVDVRVTVSRGDQIYDSLAPSIAYNPDRNQYLLVWRMDDTALGLVDNQYEVYGQILAADGTPVAPANPGQIIPPHPFNDVTPGGSNLSNFRISLMNADSSSLGDAYDPAVAYSPATREYLVVWWGDKETDGRYDIRGRFVSDQGELLGAVDQRFSDMGPSPTNAAYNAYDPDVAYNPVSQEFLVVWSGADTLAPVLSSLGRLEGDYEIHGQRVGAASRALAGGNFQISAMGPATPSVFYDARVPAVAVGGDGRYMVAWQGNEEAVAFITGSGATDYNQIYEAYGQLLDAGGNPIGPDDFRISDMGASDTDTRFGLVNGPVYLSNPDRYTDFVIREPRSGFVSSYAIGGSLDVTYDAAGDEFAVTWSSDDDSGGMQDGDTEVFVQRIRAADGAEVGVNDLRISSMGPSGNSNNDAHNPAIAYNSANDELLAVWAGSNVALLYEIHGQRLAFAPPTITLLNSNQDTGDGVLANDEITNRLIRRLLVTFSENIGNTAATNTNSYLVVSAGANTVYDTVACGPAQSDDTVVPFNSTGAIAYDTASRTTTLYLNNGSALPTGRYRLIICGTGPNAIVDSDGDTLDGDGDGDVGGDYLSNFIVDRTAPTFNTPPSLTVFTANPAGTEVVFDLSSYVSDTIDSTPTISCAPASGSIFPIGATTVSCTASDDAGNTSPTRSFLVTVVLSSVPTVTVPNDIITEATGPSGAVVTFSASASDGNGSVPVSCAPASGSTFVIGITTVTCSASNAQGMGTGSFTVTVRDTTPPTVSVPTNITAEAVLPTGAPVSFSASASDLVSGSVSVSCVPASGSTFPLGPTSVTCSATDARNNTGQASFTVTVRDTTAPSLFLPANITAEATSPAGATVTFSASASDVVDTSTPVSCTPTSGSTFPIGATTVSCSAADDSGNSATGNFTVTVRDTTAPALTLPANITAEATSPAGAAVTFSASAADTADASVTVVCAPPSGSTFPIGTTTVSCSAADDSGNSATGNFTVTVRDTAAPTLTLPANITAEATSSAGAAVTFSASATDTADASVTVVCAPPSGSTFPIGATTVSCSAADDSSNSATGSFTVTVRDTTAPTLTLPANITAEATSPAGAAVTFGLSATDAVDTGVAVSCTPTSGSTFPIGTTNVDCAATDDSNNTTTGSFIVTVRDSTAPTLGGMNNITTSTTVSAGAVVSFNVTASDLVDGSVSASCAPASGSTFPIGVTTVSCEASDSRSNRATGSFTVTVVDARIPTLAVPNGLTVEADRIGGALVSYTVSASDNNGPLTPSCAPASGGVFSLGETTVTCQVTGQNNVSTSASFVVRVVDTTRPALSLPANITREATGPSGAAVTFSATASDIADASVAVSCAPASGATFALGATTVNCSATDDSGNRATGSFTVTVRDTRAPTISPSANLTVTTPNSGGTTVTFFTPAASDLVDRSVQVVCTPASGTLFPIGITTVTCVATDDAGNQASTSFTVTVRLQVQAPGIRLYLPLIANTQSLPPACNPNEVGCEPQR